jgi:hypothetical protein
MIRIKKRNTEHDEANRKTDSGKATQTFEKKLKKKKLLGKRNTQFR